MGAAAAASSPRRSCPTTGGGLAALPLALVAAVAGVLMLLLLANNTVTLSRAAATLDALAAHAGLGSQAGVARQQELSDGEEAQAFQQAARLAAVLHLRDHVLPGRPPRRPARHALLPNVSATNASVQAYRDSVAAYLGSGAFRRRWDALKAQTARERGIVVAAGGRYYLPQALVLLRVLRHHVNCTLPVELFWHGPQEMDAVTLRALQQEFAPLEGHDVTRLPYPAHHLPGAELKGFPIKAFALLNSRFKEVLLLDADVVPLRDPAYLFDAPEYRQGGSLFWSDVYGSEGGIFNNEAFEYVGLDRSVAADLDAGRGDFNRTAESGQIVINRAQHLDVLEWAWFCNSFGEGHLYKFMYGDKDTFGLAFALAGKVHNYTHVNTPPAGIFTHRDALNWQPDARHLAKQGNWWLQAMAQHDHLGELLFVHRVLGEVTLDGYTPTDELITPPIPLPWVMWHFHHAPGDEVETPFHIAPLNISYLLHVAPARQLCPLEAWSAYWTLRTHGIPTPRNLTLEAACSQVLDAQLGAAAAGIIRRRLMANPARLVINRQWDARVDGGWGAPKVPLLAVPLNMTSAYSAWQDMAAALAWAREWARGKPTLMD